MLLLISDLHTAVNSASPLFAHDKLHFTVPLQGTRTLSYNIKGLTPAVSLLDRRRVLRGQVHAQLSSASLFTKQRQLVLSCYWLVPTSATGE
jgi:hypothetical protein